MIRRPRAFLILCFASTQASGCRHVPSRPLRDLRPGFEAQTRKPPRAARAWILRPKSRNPPPMVFRAQPPNHAPGFEAQTWKPSSDGFSGYTTKPAASSTLRCVPRRHVPPRPRHPARRVLWSLLLDPHVRRLDLVNTVTNALLRLSMSQVSATAAGCPASWSLSPSLTSALHRPWSVAMARSTPALHRSRSIGTARYAHASPRSFGTARYPDLHLAVNHCLRAPQLHTTSQEITLPSSTPGVSQHYTQDATC